MKIEKLSIVVKYLLCGFLLMNCIGCVSVKSYQKMYLNDKEMSLSDKKIESFEINYQAYREGAQGANGGKVGGGCGCN